MTVQSNVPTILRPVPKLAVFVIPTALYAYVSGHFTERLFYLHWLGHVTYWPILALLIWFWPLWRSRTADATRAGYPEPLALMALGVMAALVSVGLDSLLFRIVTGYYLLAPRELPGMLLFTGDISQALFLGVVAAAWHPLTIKRAVCVIGAALALLILPWALQISLARTLELPKDLKTASSLKTVADAERLFGLPWRRVILKNGLLAFEGMDAGLGPRALSITEDKKGILLLEWRESFLAVPRRRLILFVSPDKLDICGYGIWRAPTQPWKIVAGDLAKGDIQMFDAWY